MNAYFYICCCCYPFSSLTLSWIFHVVPGGLAKFKRLLTRCWDECKEIRLDIKGYSISSKYIDKTRQTYMCCGMGDEGLGFIWLIALTLQIFWNVSSILYLPLLLYLFYSVLPYMLSVRANVNIWKLFTRMKQEAPDNNNWWTMKSSPPYENICAQPIMKFLSP